MLLKVIIISDLHIKIDDHNMIIINKISTRGYRSCVNYLLEDLINIINKIVY